MTNYLIDTSTLFKRYINEPGTKKLDELFAATGAFFISALTIGCVGREMNILDRLLGVITNPVPTLHEVSREKPIGSIDIQSQTSQSGGRGY